MGSLLSRAGLRRACWQAAPALFSARWQPASAPGGVPGCLLLAAHLRLAPNACPPAMMQGKTGAWEEAIAVLDALEAQGIEPEIRTYNTGGWAPPLWC